MSVVAIHSESLLDFVRREGPITTRSVAYRFALEMGEARRSLKRLRQRGRKEIFGLHGGGTTLVWFVEGA